MQIKKLCSCPTSKKSVSTNTTSTTNERQCKQPNNEGLEIWEQNNTEKNIRTKRD